TATRPSAVDVMEVLQHSQARLSICVSGPRAPLAAIVVYISAISPSSSLGMFRPSSQIAASFASAVGMSETNPCWRFFPSRCGISGLLHVVPPSLENTRLTSYASDRGPTLATNQSAVSVPSDSTAIDGTSASLTNQLV